MSVGAIALFVAGLIVGSQTSLVRSHASAPSTVGMSSPAEASEAATTLSPLRMMIENKRSLPQDTWSDLF